VTGSSSTRRTWETAAPVEVADTWQHANSWRDPDRDVCDRYYALYPDDLERYGPTGQGCCDHDSRYLIAWGLEDARAGARSTAIAQVLWLGRVLAARAHPIERVAGHVESTAEVLRTSGLGELGERAGGRMCEASRALAAAARSLGDLERLSRAQ
jgi:hypothetical protein